MKPELKPCPFCGSTNIEIDHANICVVCQDCAAEGPFADAGNRGAIELWNSRAEPLIVPAISDLLRIADASLRDDKPPNCRMVAFYHDELQEFARAIIAKYGGHPTRRNPDAL